MTRIEVVQVLADGTRVSGSAAVEHGPTGVRVYDFRDCGEEALSLPSGARFEIVVQDKMRVVVR